MTAQSCNKAAIWVNHKKKHKSPFVTAELDVLRPINWFPFHVCLLVQR